MFTFLLFLHVQRVNEGGCPLSSAEAFRPQTQHDFHHNLTAHLHNHNKGIRLDKLT